MSKSIAVYIREQLILAGRKLRPYTPAEVQALEAAAVAGHARYAKSPRRLVMPWEAPGRPEVWGLRHGEVVL